MAPYLFLIKFDKSSLVPYNMVMEYSELVGPKVPLKGELLCKLVTRYPEIDLSTIQAISLIQAIGKNMSVMINRDLAGVGLTEAKLYVLAFLFTEELMGNGNPGPSQIADHIGVTRGTVTGLLDGLERDGYLERNHDARDRRALTIQITEKARTFLDEFLPSVTSSFEKVMPLDEEERHQVIELLGRIETALSAAVPPIYCDEK